MSMRVSVTRDSPSASGQSLVPLTKPEVVDESSARYPRPSAAFLAQLIAIAQGAPQTRVRRCATAGEAAALYAAAAATARPAVIKGSL
jgi:hypothetical protein